MLKFCLHSRNAWSDFFTGTISPNLNSQTFTLRQTPSGTNVYIFNCLFGPITSSSDGGALYCYNSVTYFLVESTSFFSCKTSSRGGAIYFYNSDGQCVLHEVCGYDCCTTNSNSYQFGYTRVNSGTYSKNYVNYSSITRCINENSDTYYTMYLNCGKICFPSANISLNKCYYRTILCSPSSDSNSFACSFTYSSFTDNIATGYICIFFNLPYKYEFKCCNILRNTQPLGNGEGTIFLYGTVMIDDSCILENKATYIFYTYSSSYTTTISNCTLDLTSNNGYLTIRNTVTKSFIHALNHLSTQNCHSEYDSAGYLTAIVQTPSSSKRQKLYCTHMNFFYKFPLRDFVSLICILLFNFIHPNSSYDL
jgi:hypothetical protein